MMLLSTLLRITTFLGLLLCFGLVVGAVDFYIAMFVFGR